MATINPLIKGYVGIEKTAQMTARQMSFLDEVQDSMELSRLKHDYMYLKNLYESNELPADMKIALLPKLKEAEKIWKETSNARIKNVY